MYIVILKKKLYRIDYKIILYDRYNYVLSKHTKILSCYFSAILNIHYDVFFHTLISTTYSSIIYNLRKVHRSSHLVRLLYNTACRK